MLSEMRSQVFLSQKFLALINIESLTFFFKTKNVSKHFYKDVLSVWKVFFDSGRLGRRRRRGKLTTASLHDQNRTISFELIVLSSQKVLSGSGRATRRWSMYFPIRRSLPARPEPDNTFWDDSTIIDRTLSPLDALRLPTLAENQTGDWQLREVSRTISSSKNRNHTLILSFFFELLNATISNF